MTNISTVILAAGKSTRFKSTKGKLLQDLAGLPIISHVYNIAKKISGRKIIIVCNKNNIRELKSLFSDCIFVIQKKQDGTANAILAAKPHLLNKNFLVLFGDVPLITLKSIKNLINKFKSNKTSGSMITFQASNPSGYGRVITKNNKVLKIVEDFKTNNEEQKIKLCNSGVLLVKSNLFFNNLSQIKAHNIKKEKFLPDIFEIYFNQNKPFSYVVCLEEEMLGVNTLEDYIKIDAIYQHTLVNKFIRKGVFIINPKSCRLSFDTEVAKGVTIEANVVIKEKVKIAKGTIIKSHSYIQGTVIRENCSIGPYARIRPSSIISKNVKIGNYVEIKNSIVGNSSSIAHLSYIGDTEIGKKVNIGAGTITCNFDGKNKHRTIIKDGAFIGSNSSLVAPIIINKNAKIGAGSVINKDIPAKYLAIERSKLKFIKKN